MAFRALFPHGNVASLPCKCLVGVASSDIPEIHPETEYSDPECESDSDLVEGVNIGDDQRFILSHVIMTAIAEANEYTIPKSAFSQQTEITPVLRMSIVDWMIRVVYRVKLHKTTLYNAVYVLDKILSTHSVTKDQIHLLAATSLWVSTKIEETMIPNTSLRCFVKICQSKFTKDDFTRKEFEICPLMNGRFNYPRPFFFLESFANVVDASESAIEMAQYLLEISLLAFDFVEVPAQAVTVTALAAAIGDTFPLQRLCEAARCTAYLPYIGCIMKKMEQLSMMELERKNGALLEIYGPEKINFFIEKLRCYKCE